MPVFKQPTLAAASFLIEFSSPVQGMRFHQKLAEDAFSTFIGVQSQQSNVPDNIDPNLPRIAFYSERKSILISQLGCHLNFNFSQNSDPLEKQIQILKKNCSEFYSLAINKFKVSTYKLTAIILDFQFPSDSPSESLQKFLFDRFIKTPSKHSLASIQILMGFKIDEYFVNFAAQVYETRTANIAPHSKFGPESVHTLNLDEMKIVGTGVSFRIDVNTRPLVSRPEFHLPDDTLNLFLRLENFLADDFHSLSGLHLYD